MDTNDNQLPVNKEKFNGKKESKLNTFVKKHRLVFILISLIIVIVLGFLIQIKIMEKRSVSEKEQLVNLYMNKMDSLSLSDMVLTTKVFSWAIRSEMTRQNMEQVNQYFSGFVKEPTVKNIQLIDPDTGKVLLSSDKKDEGTIIENTLILQAERIFQLPGDTGDKIISPVMGLNSRIGVLVIELEKKQL